MEKCYFISDVHLGAHSGEIENTKITNLISFFKSIENQADYLYIVGDLYDFWFEYNYAIPKVNLQVLARLGHLVQGGTEVRYLIGNHDLWHNDYLAKETGIKIYHQPLAVNHNSFRLYIAHGDGLIKKNRTLRHLKKIFAHPVNIFFYKWLHPDIGIPLAMKVAQKSRLREERRYEREYREFAIAKLEEGFNAVILGHTHVPIFEELNSKYYINVGDWMKKFTYLEMIDQVLELKSWVEQSHEETS